MACFNTLCADAGQSPEERTSSIKSGNGGKGCAVGDTACVQNIDRRGSAGVVKGICKKFVVCPISVGIGLGNCDKLVSEANSELASATVDGTGSSSSFISMGKESSSQDFPVIDYTFKPIVNPVV
ncbi:UNVERIFIED_CONTAM: hypothetical protein FKN15_067066 [Acipenser sinensis]